MIMVHEENICVQRYRYYPPTPEIWEPYSEDWYCEECEYEETKYLQ